MESLLFVYIVTNPCNNTLNQENLVTILTLKQPQKDKEGRVQRGSEPMTEPESSSLYPILTNSSCSLCGIISFSSKAVVFTYVTMMNIFSNQYLIVIFQYLQLLRRYINFYEFNKTFFIFDYSTYRHLEKVVIYANISSFENA